MRVTQYGISEQFKNQVGSLLAKQQKYYNQVTTGQKLTVASDDPAAMARVMSMQTDLNAATQYGKNLSRAQEVSTVSYQNIDNLKDMVVRAQELATSTDDLTTDAEYSANTAELNQLIEQALQLGNAKYQGDYLFSGNATATTPFVATRDSSGNVTGVTYAGSTSVSSFEIADGVQLSPYSSPTQNSQISSIIGTLVGLRDALAANDSTAVRAIQPQLLTDEDTVIAQLSDFAADQARIELTQKQHENYAASLGTQISGEVDVDAAQAIVQYNQSMNSYQAALSAGARMMQTSLLDYV
jgi:flagellar hook-associated protein 3 FlgL